MRVHPWFPPKLQQADDFVTAVLAAVFAPVDAVLPHEAEGSEHRLNGFARISRTRQNVRICANTSVRGVQVCVGQSPFRSASRGRSRRVLVSSLPLDHVIGVRIPASQPTRSHHCSLVGRSARLQALRGSRRSGHESPRLLNTLTFGSVVWLLGRVSGARRLARLAASGTNPSQPTISLASLGCLAARQGFRRSSARAARRLGHESLPSRISLASLGRLAARPAQV